MSEERYAIIFSSLTGNTRKLADTIHETLPTALCDYFGEAKSAETNAELVYVILSVDRSGKAAKSTVCGLVTDAGSGEILIGDICVAARSGDRPRYGRLRYFQSR